MFAATARSTQTLARPELYRELAVEAAALFEGERDAIANAANLSALLYDRLPALNWAGFYFLRTTGELVLGPFQGRSACVRIAVGRGVCGTAVVRRSTMLVPDVNAFPGHIACDTASRSEIVIPLVRDDRVTGVLDLDSPSLARFDEDDRAGLERLAELYVRSSEKI
jgi:GAF domain-containing protein